jgi:two-component system NtrC family response regulator/two-component system response regulator HydG
MEHDLHKGSKEVFHMSDHIATGPVQEEITLELTDYSLANAEAEATLIHKVLQETGWNLKQAAKELNIARGTLYSKMKKYGIEKPQ